MSEQTPIASAVALNPALMRATSVRMLRPEGRSLLRALRDKVKTAAAADDGSPVFTEPPQSVDRFYNAADGSMHFIPMARVAKRRANDRPHVFIDRAQDGYVLRVQIELVRHPSLFIGAAPGADTAVALPLQSIRVTLQAPASGHPVTFKVSELPLADGEDPNLVGRLACEATVDPNHVTSTLQEDPGAWFEVLAEVHFQIQPPAAAPPAGGGRGVAISGGRRVKLRSEAAITVAPRRAISAGALDMHMLRRARVSDTAILRQASSAATPAAPAAAAAPPVEPRTQTMTLSPPDHAALGAHFPLSVAANRPIYARVGGSFGANPAAAWVQTEHGMFVESPVPDQFYVLPDGYRLAFDVEHSAPAMSVLLVPHDRMPPAGPAGAAPVAAAPVGDAPAGEAPAAEAPAAAAPAAAPRADGASVTFGEAYGLRCRFAIVPVLDAERVTALRAVIAGQTGIPCPDLVLGGLGKAQFALSAVFQSLGAHVVGHDGSDTLDVDPMGFELVLDCTSEFYALLAKLVVTDGLTGKVAVELLGAEGDVAQSVDHAVSLRLDRPDTSFVWSKLEAVDEDPATPLQVTVYNPAAVEVHIGLARTTLLVVDDDDQSPLQAGPGTTMPETLVLAPAANGKPSEQVLSVSPPEAGDATPWGGVAVSLERVSVVLDPQAVLSRAQDLGSLTGMKSTVLLRCYQLQHPEALTGPLADVFGLQIELRRSDDAQPVTVYLTRDEPEKTVEISFTLTEILAGASADQPRFSWRRCNMVAAGTGDWSPWESTIGRELFVTPVGP